ncbi:MAG: hypothetical protein ACHQHK_15640 [Dongiales bacterium]
MLLQQSLAGQKAADQAGGLAALTAADYRYAFSPLVGFMVLGLVASLLIKETLRPAAPIVAAAA